MRNFHSFFFIKTAEKQLVIIHLFIEMKLILLDDTTTQQPTYTNHFTTPSPCAVKPPTTKPPTEPSLGTDETTEPICE